MRNLLEGLGDKFEGINVTLKEYPCSMHTHAAIDAVMEIMAEENINLADIEQVKVKINQQGFNFVCLPSEKTRYPHTIKEEVNQIFALLY